MSIVHDMLSEVEKREKVNTPLWMAPKSQKQGLFVFDLPREIVNDFYDLKEYIRIANLREQVRVLSIANSHDGEGSSSIATYLAFLMAGGLLTKVEKSMGSESSEPEEKSPTELHNITDSDRVFTDSFCSLNNKSATTQDEFKNWEDSIDSRYIKVDNSECNLLVDGNLHQPSLNRYFGLEVENGLSEIIEENRDWNQYAKPVKDSNLKVITAGQSRINPAELLGSDRFRGLVREWKHEFRYVIFNSPPILTYVDSLSLASVVDGVVLVVRAGQTRWDTAQNAKRKLTAAQANLLGVTLNRRKMDIPDGLYKRLM